MTFEKFMAGIALVGSVVAVIADIVSKNKAPKRNVELNIPFNLKL